jgi:hypothetical protein
MFYLPWRRLTTHIPISYYLGSGFKKISPTKLINRLLFCVYSQIVPPTPFGIEALLFHS